MLRTVYGTEPPCGSAKSTSVFEGKQECVFIHKADYANGLNDQELRPRYVTFNLRRSRSAAAFASSTVGKRPSSVLRFLSGYLLSGEYENQVAPGSHVYFVRAGAQGYTMQHFSPTKTALAVGVFLGVWHLVWSLLVALNWTQPLYDFILWAHMIHLCNITARRTLMSARHAKHTTAPWSALREEEQQPFCFGEFFRQQSE